MHCHLKHCANSPTRRRSFEDDGGTSVVVLTARLGVSAGFDLKDAEGRSREPWISVRCAGLKLGPRLTRAWQEMEQITIGAIEGFCIGAASRWRGGGAGLRIMARDAHLRVPR